jgi:opacity protein-like surface antigen
MSAKTDIGSAIKNSMDGYVTRPRVDLWPDIEAKLKKKKKRSFLPIIVVGIIAIFMGILWMFVWNDSTPSPVDPTKTEINPLDDNKDNTDASSKDSLDQNNKNKSDSKDSTTVDANGVNPSTNSKRGLTTPFSKENDSNSKSSKANSKDDRSTSKSNPKSSNINSNQGDNKLSLDLQVTETTSKDKTPSQVNLLPVDLIRLGELSLKIDSIQLYKGASTQDTITPEVENEFNWSLFPHVSLDRYNAFGRSTSDQNSFNYGIYLSYYPTKRLLLRSGYKGLNLQYNFENNSRQQQITYSEIPIEARYFITHKSRLKSSFIVGGSYLFVQNATLIDFTNNITRDNRDSFNRNIFSLNAGLGVHYDLSKRWRMNLEYIFEYHPTPFTRRQDYSPYNSSLSFGFEYRFFWK